MWKTYYHVYNCWVILRQIVESSLWVLVLSIWICIYNTYIYTYFWKRLQFENMILFVFSLKRCWQKIIGTMVFFLWCEIYMYLPDRSIKMRGAVSLKHRGGQGRFWTSLPIFWKRLLSLLWWCAVLPDWLSGLCSNHYSVSGRRLNSWRLVECQKCQSWIGGSIDIAKTCLSDILV